MKRFRWISWVLPLVLSPFYSAKLALANCTPPVDQICNVSVMTSSVNNGCSSTMINVTGARITGATVNAAGGVLAYSSKGNNVWSPGAVKYSMTARGQWVNNSGRFCQIVISGTVTRPPGEAGAFFINPLAKVLPNGLTRSVTSGCGKYPSYLEDFRVGGYHLMENSGLPETCSYNGSRADWVYLGTPSVACTRACTWNCNDSCVTSCGSSSACMSSCTSACGSSCFNGCMGQ